MVGEELHHPPATAHGLPNSPPGSPRGTTPGHGWATHPCAHGRARTGKSPGCGATAGPQRVRVVPRCTGTTRPSSSTPVRLSPATTEPVKGVLCYPPPSDFIALVNQTLPPSHRKLKREISRANFPTHQPKKAKSARRTQVYHRRAVCPGEEGAHAKLLQPGSFAVRSSAPPEPPAFASSIYLLTQEHLDAPSYKKRVSIAKCFLRLGEAAARFSGPSRIREVVPVFHQCRGAKSSRINSA